jgi:hypothetical protein
MITFSCAIQNNDCFIISDLIGFYIDSISAGLENP